MIQRIFPTINNVVPYKTKNQKTYYSIQTFDTPYTVKSRGCTAWYYAWPTYALEPSFTTPYRKFTGNAPFVKFFSGKSYPSEIAPEVLTSNQFGIIYSGYYIPESASATFFLKGQGKARITVAGGFDSGTVQLGVDRPSVATLRVTGMTAGVGRLTTIRYMSADKTSQKDNVFVVTWKDSTLTDEVPLAAGNFKNATDYTSGITSKTLRYTGEVQLSRQRNQTTQFSFSVPVVPSGSSRGYVYDEGGDYLYDAADSTRTIKKFRMVEFYAGYQYPSGTIATITKFSGQVRGWTITRKQDGSDVALVKCHDWSSFLQDTINEGFPNVADYLVADYLDPVSQEGVAGDTKPRTYDGWKFEKAMESLMYNAYIDPKTLHAKKTYVNTAGTLEQGYYEVHDRNLLENPIYLDRPFRYGNPLAVTKDGADDAYIWQFSIGDLISDNIQKLMENYGFKYGFNQVGNFYTKSMKNPVSLKSIDDMTMTSNWSERLNPRMLYGVSNETSTNGDTAVATFTGRNCRLIVNVGNGWGTLHIRMSNTDLGIVATTDISLSNSTNRHYFDGSDDSLGYNPCEINIGEGLAYGLYSLNLECKSSATVSVNAVLINDEQYFSEVETFYSGDTAVYNGVLTDNLIVESDVDNVRNDVVVVGRLLGVKSNLSLAEGEDARVNPNNPVSDHVIGRAVDRVSLASLSNSNFTGRKLQTIIVDPAIATEERAFWLATETAKRYNRFSKSVTPVFSMITNPLLELEDRIAVKDIKNGILGTYQDFWITGIDEFYGNNGENTAKLQVESFEPWESFFKYPTPSLGRFGNTVFLNPIMYNTGLPLNQNGDFCYLNGWEPNSTSPGTLNIMFSTQDTNSTTESITNRVSPFGYLKLHNEVIRYQQRTVIDVTAGATGRKFFFISLGDLKRGMYNTATLADVSTYLNQKVEMQFSPYLTEEYSIAPSVGFDLIAPGYVKISVSSKTGDLVDTPTGGDNDNEGWAYLEPGSYIYSWGCLDRYGAYNESHSGYFQRSGSKVYDTPMTGVSNLGDWIPWFGQTSNNAEGSYKVGADRYVVNQSRTRYGQFSFDVRYRDPSGLITKDIKTISGLRDVHTVRRITGNSISPVSDTDGIFEEFKIAIPESEIDYDTIATIWYSQTLGTLESNVRQLTAQAYYRRYYTGQENNGLGAKINIKNKHNQSRIVDVEVKRYVFVFLRIYRERYRYFAQTGASWKPETLIGLVDSGVETIIPFGDSAWEVDDVKGLDLYIPSVSEGFITRKALARINQAIHEDNNGLLNDYYQKDRIKSIAISHLHCFDITTVDFAGFKDYFKRSMWYVDPAFNNTKADFDSGNAKLSGFDIGDPKPYEKMIFTWRDTINSTPAFQFIDQLPGGQYTSVVVAYDENNPHAVFSEGIYGVKIFGDYL